MKREELRKILDEIDTLIFLAEKGEKERKIFAWYMFVWGVYTTLNMSLMLFLPTIAKSIPLSSWFHTLFFAFFFSSLPFAGWKNSSLWFVVYIASLLSFYFNNLILTVAIIIVGISFVSYFVYGRGHGEGSNRISTVSYIGIVWGIMFGAFWWNIALHYRTLNDMSFNLWITYVFGIGILLSGVIFRRYFLLGLFILFILPILAKFGKTYLFVGYDISALIMALLGLTMYMKDDERT